MTTGREVFVADHALDLAQVHSLTAQVANYGSLQHPEPILRKGLIEETGECIAELRADVPSRYDLEGELGDVLWYVSEISRYRGIAPTAVLGRQSLDAFQISEPAVATPIFDWAGRKLDSQAHPDATLALTALRVVDTMRPESNRLWLGLEAKIDLPDALKDLVSAAGWVATTNGLTLSAAVNHTITKLTHRTRRPHVIEESTTGRQTPPSGKRRLNVNALATALLVRGTTEEGTTA
jgi:hypothetical protein